MWAHQVATRWAALKFLFDVTGAGYSCPGRSFAKYGDEPLGPVPGDDNARAWYCSATGYRSVVQRMMLKHIDTTRMSHSFPYDKFVVER